MENFMEQFWQPLTLVLLTPIVDDAIGVVTDQFECRKRVRVHGKGEEEGG